MDSTTGEYYNFMVNIFTKTRSYLGISDRPTAVVHKVIVFAFIVLKLGSIVYYFKSRWTTKGVISTCVWYLAGNLQQQVKYILLIIDKRRHKSMLNWLGDVIKRRIDEDLQELVDKEMYKSLSMSYIFIK